LALAIIVALAMWLVFRDRKAAPPSSNGEALAVAGVAAAKYSSTTGTKANLENAVDRHDHDQEIELMPSGISQWQEHYRIRLSNTVVEIFDDEAAWHLDPVATAEFQVLLQAALAVYDLDPYANENLVALETIRVEASDTLAQLQAGGNLLSLDSISVNSLRPHELRTLTGVLRSLTSPAEPGQNGKPVARGIFSSPPEGYFSTSIATKDQLELQSHYDQAFLPWLFAKSEQALIRDTVGQLSMEHGLLYPSRKWLPTISPRYKELNEEISFYEDELRARYLRTIEGAPDLIK
jgi:hypothetical protein